MTRQKRWIPARIRPRPAWNEQLQFASALAGLIFPRLPGYLCGAIVAAATKQRGLPAPGQAQANLSRPSHRIGISPVSK